MSNDSTIFTRRTYDDIDEALAWLEQLDGEGGRRRAKIAESSGASANLPTWLRHDLKLDTPELTYVTADAEQNDKLSWLDSIAAGHGAAIEESATQSWEDTGMYARLQEARAEVAAELPVPPAAEREAPAAAAPPAAEPEEVAAAEQQPAAEREEVAAADDTTPPQQLTAPGPTTEPEGTVAQQFTPQAMGTEVVEQPPTAAAQIEDDDDTEPTALDYFVDPLNAPTIISATTNSRQLKTNSWPTPRDDDEVDEEEGSYTFVPSSGTNFNDEGANLAASIPDDPDEAIAWLERLAQQQLAGDDDDDDDVTMHAPIRFEAPPTRISKREEAPESEPTEIAEPLELSDALSDIFDELQDELPEYEQLETVDERPSSDLGAALAWLEELVSGTDQSIDDVTVELDEADVAALLDDEMEKLRERRKMDERPAPPPAAVEEEEDELDEALAWLENFAAEESSFIAPNGIAIGVDADEETLIRLFHDERSQAEQALVAGDVAAAATMYEKILATGRDGAAETVMRDVRDIVERLKDEPRLYRVWGDALAAQQRWQDAAAIYRQALEQL